ncbi:MAG: serine/threonine-protein kinase [Kofleriaceae bacterium]
MIRRLAVGGMGEIFLARQAIAGVNRLVVLKRLLPGLADDPAQLAMFVDEARIGASLAHPGIVQVHEFGEDDAGFFIVMEYVAGQHVGQLVTRATREHRAIPIPIGAFVMHEIARALDHAHHARDSDGVPLEIVHRDISPSNVLVSFRGDVKLMDFGVAQAANRTHRTNDGTIRGKFAYMAPEQLEGKPVDLRSDVFAAGVLLWELTLGRRLFDGRSEFETIRAVLEQPIPRPSTIDPQYPPELEAIVMTALERDPARRLASAAELATGLKAFLRTHPADRDDLAALMAEMFPADAVASQRLETEHTRPVAAPTVILPASPVAVPRRGRWGLVAVLGLAVAGGAFVLFPRTTVDTPSVIAVRVAAADAAPDVTVAVEPPVIDAPERPPQAVHVPTRTVRVPTVTPDAPPEPAIAIPVERGNIFFDVPRDERQRIDGAVFYRGLRCSTPSSVPTRCLDLPVGATYEITFWMSGGGEFTTTVHVKPGVQRCWVLPSLGSVRC